MTLPIILGSIGAILLCFVAVILIRTLRFQPRASVAIQDDEVCFDRDRAVKSLQTLVRFRTVSYHDRALEDDAAFKALEDELPRLYPNVFSTCEQIEIPDRAILLRWKGKTDAAPAVLMAHYDVVPVNEERWEKPPFEAILEGDVLWGRGTLDTKVTVNAILTAAESLIEKGFVPNADVYFAFSGGEEVNGEGASNIVDYFEKNGMTPALVLDEGGAVVENVFPGVSAPCGMIGIAEKGLMDVSYKAKSAGGHASAPKPHTPVGTLSSACCRIEAHPFPSHLCEPVRLMFDTLGRHSSFVYRMIFANLWCFSPLLDMICKKSGGELNALMRTTVAFTQMKGSSAPNVIPPEAEMISNIRLNPLDSTATAKAYLERVIGDPAIEVEILYGMEPSPISRTDCEGWQKVASAVASTWKGSIISPYLMMQCSDSRHWGRISDRVYRFSAMDLTSEERSTIHGNNERIRLATVYSACEFYIRLMSDC